MESPVSERLAPVPAQDNGAIVEGAYRYLLWRTWDASLPRALWILLNPSTADERIDDPTLRRCKGFSASWRFGGLEIVNLFAFRTPYPQDLYQAADPVGDANDRNIIAAVRRATCIILAWDAHGGYRQRDQAVLALLKTYTADVYCAGAMLPGHDPLQFPTPPTLYRTEQTASSPRLQRAIACYQAP